MNRFIPDLLKFSVFSIAFILLMIILWGEFAPSLLKGNLRYRTSSGYLHSKISEVRNTSDVDILFLGSSLTMRGFDTRVFRNHGLHTFNLGSAAQTHIQTKILLDRYLEKLNPEIIIYEVNPATFSKDGVSSALDLISNDKNDWKSVKMAFDLNQISVYSTLFYSLYKDIFRKNNHYSEPGITAIDTYISGGYVEREPGYYNHNHVLNTHDPVFRKNQFDAFLSIINKINDANIRLILVRVPLTQIAYETYINNSAYDGLMRSYGEFYNFNDLIQLDDTLHFYDLGHLNNKGAALFNEKLIELLFTEQDRPIVEDR